MNGLLFASAQTDLALRFRKIEEFKPEHNVAGHFVEESNFSVLFPKYREAYLRESWPMITRALEKRGIACELNLVDGSMKVATTRKTWDPAAILSARDLIRYGYLEVLLPV